MQLCKGLLPLMTRLWLEPLMMILFVQLWIGGLLRNVTMEDAVGDLLLFSIWYFCFFYLSFFFQIVYESGWWVLELWWLHIVPTPKLKMFFLFCFGCFVFMVWCLSLFNDVFFFFLIFWKWCLNLTAWWLCVSHWDASHFLGSPWEIIHVYSLSCS